jgi:hypothetical protein
MARGALATNQSLNAGASHVYTLTVNVDMDLAGGERRRQLRPLSADAGRRA